MRNALLLTILLIAAGPMGGTANGAPAIRAECQGVLIRPPNASSATLPYLKISPSAGTNASEILIKLLLPDDNDLRHALADLPASHVVVTGELFVKTHSLLKDNSARTTYSLRVQRLRRANDTRDIISPNPFDEPGVPNYTFLPNSRMLMVTQGGVAKVLHLNRVRTSSLAPVRKKT